MMAEPVRYSSLIQAKHDPVIASLIERAAREQGTTVSEWSRQAHRAALQQQGFNPAPIVPRDAGSLYNVVAGQQRYALVTPAGDILFMGYHAGKPEADPANRGVWVPVVHEDSEPFDPAAHWRLAPIVTIVDQYGGPNRVLVSYPIIPKSLEAM